MYEETKKIGVMVKPVRPLTVALLASAIVVVGSFQAYANKQGKFLSRLAVEVLEDGRKLKLIEPFSFKDSDGLLWSVPANTVVNGASIPGPAWSLIGAPLSGRYRYASVIHDHYCVTKTRPWKSVHRVFYDAMVAGGVSSWKRLVMFAAVYQFGPRWGKQIRSVRTCIQWQGKICKGWSESEKSVIVVSKPKFSASAFEKTIALLKSQNSKSPSDVERLVDAQT
ncbi:MAG: DUF1353 domain-containing protein, partial [Rhizobiaceae bacterium]